MSGPVANYAEAKRRAAEVILNQPAMGLLDNPDAVRRAAEGKADRDTMFNLTFSRPVPDAAIEFYHDYEGVPETCKDEAGNTLQACRLRVRVSWHATDKVDPVTAYVRAKFLVKLAELADDINQALISFGTIWEVILEAPGTRSASEAA